MFVLHLKGLLTLDNPEIMPKAVISGLGIAYVPERVVLRFLLDAQLMTVLEDWCPPIHRLFLYHLGTAISHQVRRHPLTSLGAFCHRRVRRDAHARFLVGPSWPSWLRNICISLHSHH
ncbi:LysR substrate-binding domain-containing protein [Pseudomonas syringae]|uniref:LysR substrate-binding domain-containing protein n=1 Tax=Pseudomonas syringae TaxID=317 RepID=UPI0009B323E9